MAGLRIFQLDLPTVGALSAWRVFGEQLLPFRLEASALPDVFWSMSIHDAARLGHCADTIGYRFRGAAKRDEGVKIGAVFIRRENDGNLIIELGIVDDDSIYLQFFGLRATLRGEQSRQLLAALRRLGDDASSIRGAGNSLGLAQ
jgi:hypothetical protein